MVTGISPYKIGDPNEPATFSASFSASPTKSNSELNSDLFAANNNSSPSDLFAPNPEISFSLSPGNPLEHSSACLVSDIEADPSDVQETPSKDKKKSLKSVGIAVSIGRYFGRNKNGKGTATDAESSDAENASVVSGGSRLFGNRRAKQHHLLQ